MDTPRLFGMLRVVDFVVENPDVGLPQDHPQTYECSDENNSSDNAGFAE